VYASGVAGDAAEEAAFACAGWDQWTVLESDHPTLLQNRTATELPSGRSRLADGKRGTTESLVVPEQHSAMIDTGASVDLKPCTLLMECDCDLKG
jgi:hypothetical protein